MTSGEVFEGGEPVMVVEAGTLTEPVGATTAWPISELDAGVEAGIACFGPGSGNINPMTGVAFAALGDIAYWPINEGTVFITRNVFTGGDTTTLLAPARTHVGDYTKMNQASLNTAWGVEMADGTVGTEVLANIVEVLDTNKDPIRLTNLTGVYALFTITATKAAT